MIDLAPYVRAGSGVWWSQGSAEPTPLVQALLSQANEIVGSGEPIRAFAGMSLDNRLATDLPASVRLSSYGALGTLRMVSSAGRLVIVPCHYSQLPRLFSSGDLPCDVGLVQVSPPGPDGFCTLGIGVDYAADAAAVTPILIAEVNARMPPTKGGPLLPLDRFSAIVETDRPLPESPERSSSDDVERAIARNIASLIEDGDTIQLGVGSLPSAVLEMLGGHRELGVHSGVITDSILSLVNAGQSLTPARRLTPD